MSKVVAPSPALFADATSRIPYIKAYQRLVSGLILDPGNSSIYVPNKSEVIGDVDLRLYALGMLYLAATSQRYPCDSLIAICVSFARFAFRANLCIL